MPIALVSAAIGAFLYLPLAVVLVFSFNNSRHGGAWREFTTEWYRTLWHNPAALNAATNTLILAAASTVVATFLGTLLALGLNRGRFRGKSACELSLLVPVIIPDIVMAVALLMFFYLVREALGVLQPGLLTMILAHITFEIPFVTMIVRARLRGLDPALEEAARDLGANSWQTFRRVKFPLLRPGILAGALLAFTLSLDDFIVSFFTTGPGATTLPILIYSSVKRGITPDINALSSVLIVIAIASASLLNLLQRRRETTYRGD